MKRVRQKHANGCAVASLAMIADIKYDEALLYAHPNRKPGQPTGTPVSNLIDALFELGIACKKTYYARPNPFKKDNPIFDFNSLKSDAIVIIWCPKSKITKKISRHAVVWDSTAKKILDPSSSYRSDYYPRNVSEIIEIRRPKV